MDELLILKGQRMNRIETTEDMLVFAFRYCLGRQTLSVLRCVAELKRVWATVTIDARRAILVEARKAISQGTAGDDFDAERWREFCDWAVKANVELSVDKP